MAGSPQLYWLPPDPEWRVKVKHVESSGTWDDAIALANSRLDFIQTNALDAAIAHRFGGEPPAGLATKPIRLALLGSCTLTHLLPAIHVGAVRRGLWLTTYENGYGQYLQELSDATSPLYRFKPNAILFAFDAHHVAAGIGAAMAPGEADAALNAMAGRIQGNWRQARGAFNGLILQQTILPTVPALLGGNEQRLAGSRAEFVARLNDKLRDMADAEGVDLVAIDRRAAQDGLAAWHDPGLWHRTKQDVIPSAAPVYGDLVGRVLAARQGRSYKCLVLDLDNTIWGGVIGDDGMDGIVLGQGSGEGEAFLAVQDYARELSRRGVILAVCSKNDEANVIEVFERHPEMILRRGDIASLVANWQDKASNLRAIAEELNIGLDALVFVDDNPAERSLIRRELPMVAVPEVPEEPSLVPQCLADAGYFEAVAITAEDRERTRQYQGNRARETLRTSATDLPSFLRSLDMELVWGRFDATSLQRVVQLINKTNQFNLTTRRYGEEELRTIMADRRAFGLRLRLLDRFGDNGIVAIIVGKLLDDRDLLIDTWLMSCRVLGRQIEQATLNLIVGQARSIGAGRLIGEYLPTKKNGMVRDHYRRLGFAEIETRADGYARSALDLDTFKPADIVARIVEG